MAVGRSGAAAYEWCPAVTVTLRDSARGGPGAGLGGVGGIGCVG